MAYHLAISISGAVSLGSYEAGVMFEVIRAIGAHNRALAAADADKRIEIDILTGASAGGMTAVILAQKLLFEGDSLADPTANHLYQPWVQIADVNGMLQMCDEEDPGKSILSSAFIAGIADQFLLGRYQAAGAPPKIPHPAAAPSIRLGLALSNMNGVDYSIRAFDGAELAEPKSRFVFTRFQDRMTRTVTGGDDTLAFWKPLAKAACACGAFPFAFRPLYVPRDRKEPDYQDERLDGFDFPPYAFTYTDGGVFDNSPLGMAKTLANELDRDPRDYERRFFLYVSPDRKKSTVNFTLAEDNATLFTTGKALALNIFQQGRFQDWIRTADYNEWIRELDDRAGRLREHLRRIPDGERDAMGAVADRLLEHIYDGRAPGEPTRDEDYGRLRAQFMVDAEARSLLAERGEPAVAAWIKAIQVLEQSGRLGRRDIMKVYTVTASDKELAGEGLAAFAGFFDRRFRDFDYTVGRQKARQFLQNLKNQATGGGNAEAMPLTEFTLPPDIPAIDPALGEATLADVDENVRQALRERFSDRAERFLEQFGMPVLIRKPVMWFYVNGKLKKLLQLD